MEIPLAYGKTVVKIRLPGQIHSEIVEPRYVEGLPHQQQAVKDALDHPLHHPPLSTSVKSGQKVAILFSDITRATPYPVLIPSILDAISHLPDRNITFFCACGTHRPATAGELVTILGKEVVERFRIVQNKASEPDQHVYVGTTRSGNRILLNKEILEYDLPQ